METELKSLIGRTIEKIFINQRFLKFVTDNGEFVYEVIGDCCSESYFYDFYGVVNILGKTVGGVEIVNLMSGDVLVRNTVSDEYTQVYGYQIFNDGDGYRSPTTSVFSFRNLSNGYYGGEIRQVFPKTIENEYYKEFNWETGEMKAVTKDIIELNIS